MINGPIIIVDDDADDRDIYAEVIRSMGIQNPIRYFSDALQALEYLQATSEQPFVILSDVNMPRMSGLEFKEHIQASEYLRLKGIPFIFISTNASPTAVRKAHVLSVQGYFVKPSSMAGIQSMLTKIFDYWELCKHINSV